MRVCLRAAASLPVSIRASTCPTLNEIALVDENVLDAAGGSYYVEISILDAPIAAGNAIRRPLSEEFKPGVVLPERDNGE